MIFNLVGSPSSSSGGCTSFFNDCSKASFWRSLEGPEESVGPESSSSACAEISIYADELCVLVGVVGVRVVRVVRVCVWCLCVCMCVCGVCMCVQCV
jgi:hypothetical protein